jgi:TonB family protein
MWMRWSDACHDICMFDLTRRGLRNLLRCMWPGLLVVAIPCAAEIPSVLPRVDQSSLFKRERKAWNAPSRASEFDEVPHVSARSRCEDTQPPEALATPDPLLVPAATGVKVKVSFIIGSDGRVHSPLILESAGATGDRNVLQTVRGWRYRPATCNGVPTEAEGKIEFSRR